jgi:hypothetical protein
MSADEVSVSSATPRQPWSATCVRSGRPGYPGVLRCARSAAHCTTGPPWHPAVRSGSPPLTRSRWFLIRSSSIVITFPSGLGVVSFMASCCPGCVWQPPVQPDSGTLLNCAKHSLRHRVRKCPEFFAHLFWAERRPALAQPVMAPLICWSLINSMFKYLLVDHAVPAM